MTKTDSKKTMPKNDAKIYKKSWLRHYKILLAVKNHGYASNIARQLNLNRTTVDYHINKLHAGGYIELDVYSSAKLYVLTDKGRDFIENFKMPKSSLPTKTSRLHTLRVSLPILEDNPDARFEKVNRNFKNWVPKYATVKFPIGVTLEKTPKNVIAMFHEYETKRQTCFTDFFSWVMRGTYYVYYYMMNQMKIRIDIFNAQVTHQHLANEEARNERVDGKQTTTVALGRFAKSFFGDAGFDAHAWVDFSKGRKKTIMDIETDDLLYQERLLMMPETIHQVGEVVVPTLMQLRQEVNLHLEIQRRTLEGQKEDREIRRETLKVLKELRGRKK